MTTTATTTTTTPLRPCLRKQRSDDTEINTSACCSSNPDPASSTGNHDNNNNINNNNWCRSVRLLFGRIQRGANGSSNNNNNKANQNHHSPSSQPSAAVRFNLYRNEYHDNSEKLSGEDVERLWYSETEVTEMVQSYKAVLEKKQMKQEKLRLEQQEEQQHDKS